MKPINCGSIQIQVLASGKGWLIVDKPAGMTVHNCFRIISIRELRREIRDEERRRVSKDKG